MDSSSCICSCMSPWVMGCDNFTRRGNLSWVEEDQVARLKGVNGLEKIVDCLD